MITALLLRLISGVPLVWESWTSDAQARSDNLFLLFFLFIGAGDLDPAVFCTVLALGPGGGERGERNGGGWREGWRGEERTNLDAMATSGCGVGDAAFPCW